MPAKSAGILYITGTAINRYSRMLGLLAGLLMSTAAWAQQTDSAPDPTKPQYTEKGAEKCMLCHSGLRMELMTETKHGNRGNPDAPFAQHDCESCHGPGSFHVTRSRRGKGRPPMTTFGSNAKTPVEQQVQVCLGCHAKNRTELLKIKGHENAREVEGLSCSNCHTVHLLPPGHEQEAADFSSALIARSQQPAEYTERGTQKCLLCHAESRMTGMAGTPHGNKNNPGTPFAQHGCESCHGKGSLHVSRSMRGKGRPPMTTFGNRAKTPRMDQIQTCLTCHEKDREELMKIPGHKNAKRMGGLYCSTCHTMHPFEDDWSGRPSAAAKYTELGPRKCLLCHADKHIDQVINTVHGDTSNPHTPFAQHGCETCHGKGSLHVSRSRLGKGRPPMLAFGEDKHTPVALQTTVCLGCHSKDMGTLHAVSWDATAHSTSASCINCHEVHAEGGLANQARKQTHSCIDCHADGIGELAAMEWQDSVHDQQELACSDCHAVHTEADPLMNKQVQAETCFSCHEDRETEHPRFEDKFIDFDSLSCWTCHDVHQLIPQHTADAETPKQEISTSLRANE